jgi:tetratricopeptide (TPR) repeat protein
MGVTATWNKVGAQAGIVLDAPTAESELSAYEQAVPRADIRVYGRLGSETIDVVATRLSLDALLRRIALDTNRKLVGLDLLSRQPEVTVKLVDTDLRDALRWIGGSVGLQITMTTSEIKVSEDLTPYPTRKELYERAYGGYFRALADHPDSSMAPAAAWNRARIDEESPARALEAARAYDDLVERFPKSDLIPEAMLRAGKLFGKANAWDEAAARFDTLAGLKTQHDYSIEARRLLADAHTRIAGAATNRVVARESARRAILVLDALDDLEETQDPADRRARYMVRSRAHSLAGEPVQAMRCLDRAIEYSDYGDADPELAELRALAFDRAERYADAVRAWLFHASLMTGEARRDSYTRAAEASNQGRQFLATIAIAKTAGNEGFTEALAPFRDAALVALDLEPERIDLFGDNERIERGERLAERGMTAEAVEALRPIFARSNALDDETRLRLASALAEALVKEKEVDEAMLVLRTAAESLARTHQRQSIYQLAATLLEDAGEIERAIAALEGSL